jgi:ubiquinone/menaquinone biosynthesis C-methylase UbiE
MTGQRTLKEIHEDVPPDYYDTSLKTNLIQRVYPGRRFKKISGMVSKVNGPVLDIGCDGGTLLEHIAARAQAPRVVGIDLSDEAVAYTRSKRPDFDLLVGDAERLPFRDGSFEAIFASEVLEHIHHPEKLFLEVRRCLSAGGYGLVAVPSETPLFKFLWFLWTRFGKGRVWHHAHVQDFGGKALDRLIEEAGFRIVQDSRFLLGMLRAVKIAPA